MAVPVRTKTRRRQQLEQALLYPLDWTEERSGLVGAVRYFLFRKVPGDISWGHTLGSASLTAFIVQAVTGVVLAFYYKPDPNSAYESIRYITDDLTLGWLLRGMHRWGASVFIILLYLLPWDQTAYWATVVGVNLQATGPFVGPFLGPILQGGAEIGDDTLARFYS